MTYLSIDSGKFATKVAKAKENFEGMDEFRFRTKVSEGNFDDDAVEKGTYIAEIDGQVYKIGNGALRDAELDTSKKTNEHLVSTLLSHALVTEKKGQEFCTAIGMPIGPYRNVEERKAYKEYILPLGEHEVIYMNQDGQKVCKTFSIKEHFVYPESAGGLYLDMQGNKDDAAILDMGNVNVSAALYQNFEPIYDSSKTSELGGQMLISGLAAALSSEFASRVDERLVSRVLRMPREQRFLSPAKPNPEIEKASKEFIDKYLLEHVKDIKRVCDGLRWPLAFMNLTSIGGTSELLKYEIKEVFGDTVVIPEKPEFANVRGFLRRLVAWKEKKLLPV